MQTDYLFVGPVGDKEDRMKKIARLLISMAISVAIFLSSTSNANSVEMLGDINGDARVGLQESIYALQVAAGLRPQLSKRTIDNFTGIWKGNGTFVARDESNTGIMTVDLSIGESSLTGYFVYGTDAPVNITGTLTNDTFTFAIPNSDPNNANCANWSVSSTASLDESLKTMTLIAKGVFCGTGGGKPGIFSAIMTKQPEFTGTYNAPEQYDLNISDGIALGSGSGIFEVTQIDANNLTLQGTITNPDEGTFSFQLPLAVFDSKATLPTHPYDLGGFNLLDSLLLSDGSNMALAIIGQEYNNPADISLTVANWIRNPKPVTIDAFVGEWKGDYYSNANLRDTKGGFYTSSISGNISKIDADTISITMNNVTVLLKVVNGRATLANAPVTGSSAVYHAISMVSDGSGISWYMVATELNDPTDVSVTVGLMTKP